jgi:site-specific recombinase XerD
LSEGTLDIYKYHLRKLATFLESKTIFDTKFINRTLILAFIDELILDKKSSLVPCLSVVRRYLRYLFDNRITNEDYSIFIPKSKRVDQPQLPSIYTPDEITRLLSSVDRSGSKGKRDYAMLLLVIRYGLRSEDVCGLKFENLDWDKSVITIKQSKTQEHISFSIITEVGEAIIDYLKFGRPISNLPFVFLHVTSPFDRINYATLHSIVTKYLRCAGIHFEGTRKHGPHALRHSLVATLMEKKTPLPVISSILGHKNIDSTKFYLRIDLESLKNCTLDAPDMTSDFYKRIVK